MRVVDPALEPDDTSFVHAKSRHRYEVLRQGGALWHRELLLRDGRQDVVMAEHPVTYAVGSGRYAQTYLAEADGFLVESPVTWYSSRQQWGMSPGYDRDVHMGFGRGVGEGCLSCHAGRVESLDKSLHRMRIHEAAISCERCHGPGSLHVALQETDQPNDSLPDIDYTIVNPRHLGRKRVEAICQQCHLHGEATVLVRGRQTGDFRPGLPLQDFRQDYVLEIPDRPMTVVGHVEQMHASKCYQQSETLTCTTCHNPHDFPLPQERTAYYRDICQKCHPCSETESRRRSVSPDNDCVQCHMPSSPTEVPHVSFTHHRIGKHDRQQNEQGHPTPPERLGTLRPFLPNPRLGKLDQQRSLGLAYLNLSQYGKQKKLAPAYRQRAFELLSRVHAAGLRDATLEASLARLHFERGNPIAFSLANSALEQRELVGLDLCKALFVQGAELYKRRQFQTARKSFQRLVTLRRHADDWLLLARCEEALGNPTESKKSMNRALRIRPSP